MMNKAVKIWLAVWICLTVGAGAAWADPMDELIEKYDQSFESVVPPAHSSINSDYKYDQIAMGGRYTAKSIQLLYRQNQAIARQQADAIEKYDRIIEQNKEIIRLLKVIAKEK